MLMSLVDDETKCVKDDGESKGGAPDTIFLSYRIMQVNLLALEKILVAVMEEDAIGTIEPDGPQSRLLFDDLFGGLMGGSGSRMTNWFGSIIGGFFGGGGSGMLREPLE